LTGTHHQLAAGYQNFLVGQANTFLTANGLIGGFQAFHADDGRHDETRLWSGRRVNPRARSRSQLGHGNVLGLQEAAEIGQRAIISHYSDLGFEFGDLAGQQLDVFSSD
jgi:hypothetical protein